MTKAFIGPIFHPLYHLILLLLYPIVVMLLRRRRLDLLPLRLRRIAGDDGVFFDVL